MLNPISIVFIFILFKLLQAVQNAIINCISMGKSIALTGKNNQKAVQAVIGKKSYTHVFTNSEIALLKKVKPTFLIIRGLQTGFYF